MLPNIKSPIDRLRAITCIRPLIRDTQTNTWRLVMTAIALCCTRQSRAPNIDCCTPERFKQESSDKQTDGRYKVHYLTASLKLCHQPPMQKGKIYMMNKWIPSSQFYHSYSRDVLSAIHKPWRQSYIMQNCNIVAFLPFLHSHFSHKSSCLGLADFSNVLLFNLWKFSLFGMSQMS